MRLQKQLYNFFSSKSRYPGEDLCLQSQWKQNEHFHFPWDTQTGIELLDYFSLIQDLIWSFKAKSGTKIKLLNFDMHNLKGELFLFSSMFGTYSGLLDFKEWHE